MSRPSRGRGWRARRRVVQLLSDRRTPFGSFRTHINLALRVAGHSAMRVEMADLLETLVTTRTEIPFGAGGLG